MANQSRYAILQYSGRYFAGWQRQPNERTVQGVVEDGLERIVGHRVVTHAAGRTDAGVASPRYRRTASSSSTESEG